jgi:RNA polymerase sigma-70 factor (ECF subfamily)
LSGAPVVIRETEAANEASEVVTFFQRRGGNEVVEHALAHADALFSLARWLTGSASEAEDLVQETYARALSSAPQFERGTNLRAWLLRILRNLHVDRRRASAPDASEVDIDELPAPAGEPAQLRAVVSSEVAEAVAALPEAFRTVILLDLEGLNEREVSEVLGCAEGTVKSRLSRARAALRARLAAYGPEQ